MAGGYPLSVNGVRVLTSEALYQACRFPHLPNVQRLIIEQTSPMTAKMKSRIYHADTRSDWMAVRVRTMRWCLRVKLAQNWDRFGLLLLSTGDKPIVEYSKRDPFWGASPTDSGKLEGINVLGRLLMELREQLRGEDKDDLRIVPPLDIPQFLLYGEPIGVVSACELNNADSLTHKGSDKWLRAIEANPEGALLVSQQSELNPSRAIIEAKQVKSTEKSPKRLIEVDLPIKRISAHARREKEMRRGHVPQMYIWPATRPPSACRAVICAALWFDPADNNCPPEFRDVVRREMRKWARDRRGLMSAESYEHFEAAQKKPELFDDDEMLRTLLLDFIADFANWDNSTRREYLETSRSLTEAVHIAIGGELGTRPLVVDPFAGGGAIPIEALRVGADTYASDLNPVAVLMNKVVLEYIPRYGRELAEEVRKWGDWAKPEAIKGLSSFYPADPNGDVPIAYLWARTIICEGPGCGAEVPVMRSLWLAKKGKSLTALRIVTDSVHKRIEFRIIEKATPKDVAEGTVRRGSVTCPICRFTTPVSSVRRQLKERRGGANDARMFCVVTTKPGQQGRTYRIPNERDLKAVRLAAEKLKVLESESDRKLSLVPNEHLPVMSGVFNAPIYGHNTWGSLFNQRQLLALVTYSRLAREYAGSVKAQNKPYADGLAAVLGLIVNRLADLNASLCGWQLGTPNTAHVFTRWALPMMMDFGEVNPLAGAGGSPESAIRRMITGINDLVEADLDAGTVIQASATEHPLLDDSAQAFITDPPYYNAVPYADLSDFFYVWLRRSLGTAHSDLFSTPLSPKDEEICEMAGWDKERYKHKDKTFYEHEMRKAMAEGRRVLSPKGIGVVVFAHKSTAGWEAQLQSMVDAGWIITGSWAIDTEMGSRMRAQGSAALASSVHLICRPRENEDGSVRTNDVGDWRDVLRELPVRIHEWMPRLAEEGVVGADAIFACLGPALEVFSRYSRVEKASGEQVTLREYLEYVWAAVAKEALSMIFAGEREADVTGFEEDARLTAMWLWTLFAGSTSNGDKQLESDEGDDDIEDDDSSTKSTKSGGFTLEYDTARKIAQGLGAHLEELSKLVEVKGDKARLLPVAERTKYLFGKDEAEAPRATRKKKDKQAKLFETLDDVEAEMGGWGDKSTPQLGDTVLDRVHQAMILFASGRGDAMKRFLVDDGVGNDERFWRLANALSALYPLGGDEKRWVDGVLARKKGLGF